MSEQTMSFSGYVCAPYLHTDYSMKLKESWANSVHVEKLFFATGTFSNDSKPYFPNSSNHYLLAKFTDGAQISDDLTKFNQEKTSFVFNVQDELFERDVKGNTNFVSVYYFEYGEDGDDLREIANLLLKRDKIEKAGFGSLDTFCMYPPKFTFPFSENIMVLEMASEKGHQSVNTYCEKTRRDVTRKGFSMTSLVSFSILKQFK